MIRQPRLQPRDLLSRFVHPDRAGELVDDIFGAVLRLESLARLEVERDHLVTLKHLAGEPR